MEVLQNIFSEHKTNPEQTWEAVRSLINVKLNQINKLHL